jgi:hypothetical protein
MPLDVARLSGALTPKTLLLRARQGMLTVYWPGKVYLTTLADVQEMIRACRVNQGGRGCYSASRYNADGTDRIFTHWKLQAFGAPKLWKHREGRSSPAPPLST